jgi:hypothetical protein
MSKCQWPFHRCSSGLMHGVMSVPSYLNPLSVEAWCTVSLSALGHVLSHRHRASARSIANRMVPSHHPCFVLTSLIRPRRWYLSPMIIRAIAVVFVRPASASSLTAPGVYVKTHADTRR